MSAVLTVLALLIPLGIYLASSPRKSPREARIRAALPICGAALAFCAAANTHPNVPSLVLELVCGMLMLIAGVSVMLKHRKYTSPRSR
jgi:uncharacterized membrane protein YfcA